LLLASTIINAINLAVHPGSKTIESTISAQHQVVMGAHSHLRNFDPIGENLNWLFSVEIQRITNPHLAILVIAKSKKAIILGEEQIMKLPCVYLGNWRVEFKF
jgi:hypothetical protein